MARIRSIKPEFFLHEGLAELSPLHRLFFIGLWTLADKEGRLEHRPKRIKAAIFPWEDCDVEKLIADLDAAGFVTLYQVDGVLLIWIPKFKDHQRPHPKEAKSLLPEPTPEVFCREITRLAVKGFSSIPSCPAGKEILEKEISVSGKEPPALPVGGFDDAVRSAFRESRGHDYDPPFTDANVARALLAKYGEAETLRRWSIALGKRFPACSDLSALLKNWNAYGTADPPPVGSKPPIRRIAASDHPSQPQLVEDLG